ncbi:zinc-binding dehydrogenase [Rhodococcus erythropolis]|uniref:Zinc-binding dehydrogenase n=1 Tax=Rhodococcus erythropolis TaxID=1833 RepID=A0AAX3ZYR3_RHOER|nr:zinc-binding dehydrogenase [Rhodococcus erythropolis]WMN01754.1 zinc-binding dehydrogenase [Rhodococcus erythropolis]
MGPVESKYKWALDFGATESYDSIGDAMDRVRHLTNGQGADVAILTAGLVHNDLIGEGYQAIRKASTVIVAGMSPVAEEGVIQGVNAFGLAIFQKRIQGALYGMKSPREATPMLLKMYRAGKLKLDELVTTTYTLDQSTRDLTIWGTDSISASPRESNSTVGVRQGRRQNGRMSVV